MNEKKIGVVLGIINIVFFALLGFFYMGKDREAPLLALEETNLIYREGMQESQLLTGVRAVDEKDGDISDSIVIEKIVTDPAQELAVITYGIMDKAGNTAKASRTVKMLTEETQDLQEPADKNTDGGITEENSVNTENEFSEEEGNSNDREENLEEENSAERENENTDNREEDSDDEERNSRQDTEESAAVRQEHAAVREPQNTEGSTASQQRTEEGRQQETQRENTENHSALQEELQQALPTAGEASNDMQVLTQEQQRSIAPELVFSAGEVYTTKGYHPAWVTVIGKIADNKDSYEYLFGTLKVKGNYDRNTPGNYDVQVSITDSDGNETVKPIRIVVGE